MRISMRRLLLVASFLSLFSGLAVGQEFIRYYPPAGVSTSTSTPGFSYTSNVGSLVNGTNAQMFNISNTFTDASNYERLRVGFTGNVAYLQTEAAGTGTLRTILVGQGGYSGTRFGPNYTSPGSTDSQTLGESSAVWSNFYLSRSIQGSKSKTLTDAAAAVSFVRIAVPTNGYIGGKVIATANSTDGTNRLTTTSEWYFAGADTAGTVTCGAPSAVGTPATAYRRGNTLVCTLTSVTSTTNCDLQVTCTDNLAGDQTPIFEWRLDMPSPATVTPQ